MELRPWGNIANMWNVLMVTARWIWVVTLPTAGTTLGAMYGWAHHGAAGAAVLGFVGLAAGAIFASAPALLLEILFAL